MKKRVFVTGVGCIIGEKKECDGKYYAIEESQYKDIISHIKINNVDRISRQCIAATQLMLNNMDNAQEQISDRCGIFFGTAYGPLDSIHKFDTVSVEKGALFVNPSQFPNTVLNSPACRMGIQFDIAGPVYTLSNGITSSLDAIGLGYCQVRNDISSFVIAGGGDEVSDIQLKASKSEKTIVEGCGFVALESDKDASKEGKVLEIIGYDTFSIHIEDIKQISYELSSRIRKLAKEANLDKEFWSNLSIYSSLCKEATKKISQEIKKSLDHRAISKVVSEDYIGAGGVIQVFEIMKYDRYRYDEEDLYIILNIDESKATMLLLR
ncbi:beta-ketoacyl synthase N-terminal-like domain-containing protein [Wukongibacter sp. M2B1]|uniref:beta-ketoacyl synthase N-terminal-like domain-containing protein n=1 Tax=Wukongibacter sp. M2B1 TaxID=3088895 RepID=UPI003D79BDA6